MGKKMLVALMMEGKFSGEGIHSLESDDDMMSAMARELVERGRVGESSSVFLNGNSPTLSQDLLHSVSSGNGFQA